LRLRAVESRVKVARLSEADIADYLCSGEWRGKAAGYAIQGRFARHVEMIVGSHTNIVGLPARETFNLLKGAGLAGP
jgi:septum formation protein